MQVSRTEALRCRFLLCPPCTGERPTARQANQAAAVMIPLVERQQELFVLLTRRTLQLRHHAGQICFPGGKYDLADGCLRQTALRETMEELGIAPHQLQVWGSLAQQHTVSGFAITPFIAALTPDYRPHLAADEVAEAFELPLQPLLDRRNYGHWALTRSGKRHTVMGIVQQQRLIWGATARILFELACQLGD